MLRSVAGVSLLALNGTQEVHANVREGQIPVLHCQERAFWEACCCTGANLTERPWLRRHIRTPAAAAREKVKRPLIYVYDLPAEFNSRMLQYPPRQGLSSAADSNNIDSTRGRMC